MRRFMRLRRVCIIFIIILGSTSMLRAEEATLTPKGQEKGKVVKERTIIKEVQGEVTWVGDKYISIIYQRDPQTGEEYDIILPYNKANVKLDHIKKLKDLSTGDIIRIQYEETVKQEEGKAETAEVSRKAKAVGFVGPAVKRPQITIPEASVLDSNSE